jgi:hypothetical protein
MKNADGCGSGMSIVPTLYVWVKQMRTTVIK